MTISTLLFIYLFRFLNVEFTALELYVTRQSIIFINKDTSII